MMNDKPYHSTKGFTFQIVFGSWAKLRIESKGDVLLRICLGYCAISLIKLDMEALIHNMNVKDKSLMEDNQNERR